jgi:hypothetical protein
VKRLSPILLFTALAAILYINIGDLARISIGLANAKMDAKEKLNVSGNLQQLVITLKDIASGKAIFTEKNEVRYHGHLYDIANQKQDGDNVYLQVVQDEKEEGLLSDLKEHVESWFNSPQKNTDKKPTLKHTDLLKDFIPSSKMALSCTRPFIYLFPAASIAPASLSVQVIKCPPKLG